MTQALVTEEKTGRNDSEIMFCPWKDLMLGKTRARGVKLVWEGWQHWLMDMSQRNLSTWQKMLLQSMAKRANTDTELEPEVRSILGGNVDTLLNLCPTGWIYKICSWIHLIWPHQSSSSYWLILKHRRHSSILTWLKRLSSTAATSKL